MRLLLRWSSALAWLLLLLLDFDEDLDMVGLPCPPSLPPLPPCLKASTSPMLQEKGCVRGQIEYQTQQQQHDEEDEDDDVING